jgi:cyclopropane-fatty-acyl-phospholipid synthase
MLPSRRPAAGRIAELVEPILGPLPVRLRAWDGSERGPADAPALVISRRALRRLLWSPHELGVAQAYVTGELDVEGDLAEGLRRMWAMAAARPAGPPALGARQRLRLARAAIGLGAVGRRPAPPSTQAALRGETHSRRRDRAAIAHHYDLSNDFYALILDESMAYSSGYWTAPYDPRGETGLAEAQRDKLELICAKLDLRPGMRLLDVGCGWGSLILHAAQQHGVHATGITLSAQQHAYVSAQIARRGLDDRVEVRLQDYRDLEPVGRGWDAVSSIEMGEHVGQGNYPVYAGMLHRALAPGGRLLLQQMSRRSGAHGGGGQFIEAFIAPDMHMRPVGQTVDLLADAGFEIRDVHALREHYVWTVQAWLDNLDRHADKLTELIGEEAMRVWRLYLIGGALSFEQGRMGVDQVLAVRPGPNGASRMPARRADLITA